MNFDSLSVSYPDVAKALASNFEAHELALARVVQNAGTSHLEVSPAGHLTPEQTTTFNERLKVAVAGVIEVSVVLPNPKL
jgi:hypothetical protein